MIKLFDQNVLNSLGKKIIAAKQTLAVAESVTSGLIQFAVGSIKDALLFFQGGTTTYTLCKKVMVLAVDPVHGQEVNAVSETMAGEMADNVAELFNSDWGIGITGYASPVPESGNNIFAYYAITFRKMIKDIGKIIPPPGDPFANKLYYTNMLLNKFHGVIER